MSHPKYKTKENISEIFPKKYLFSAQKIPRFQLFDFFLAKSERSLASEVQEISILDLVVRSASENVFPFLQYLSI